MNTAIVENAPVKTISTPGGPLEYADAGAGPAVICLHGAMGGFDQSQILAAAVVPEKYRTLALSRPGYLGTPLTVGRDAATQADRCAGLLDALGIENAAVVAVSGGGPCAINFALHHRPRCRALVLISTCSERVTQKIPFTFRILQFLSRFPSIAAWMKRKTMENLDKTSSRTIPDADLRRRTLSDPFVGPLYRALTESTLTRMAERMKGTNNDIRISRTEEYPLEEIAVPTLVVHGEEDQLVPWQPHGQGLTTRIPGVESCIVEGAGHAVIFSHNDMIRERVESFLARRAAWEE